MLIDIRALADHFLIALPNINNGDDHKMIKCSTWKRRMRKTKPYGDQGKGNS